MGVKELIGILQSKHKSSTGFMGVELDGVKSVDDLIENVKDEILITSQNIEYDGETIGMTVREAKGYIKKLNAFLSKYESKSA